MKRAKASKRVMLEQIDDESLIYQIQNSIYAYNRNFKDRTCDDTESLASYHSHQIHCGDGDNTNQQEEICIQRIQYQQQQQQHKSTSTTTRDYLYLQWIEAIGNLSFIMTDSKIDTGDSITSNVDDVNAVALSDGDHDKTSYFDLWFQKLWDMHTDYTTRHYHTVVHLEEMCFYLQLIYTRIKTTNDDSPMLLNQVEGTKVLLPIKSLILLSIFFHDAIYNVHSSTNEEDSAILFESSFAQHTNLHLTHIQLVVSYIIATKHHIIDDKATIAAKNITTTSIIFNGNDNVPPCCDPLQLFLDLDMSVLGKDIFAYHQYSILIRNEYSFVPVDTYCTKRADILEQFLTQSKQIYYTTIFYDAFEERARINLQHEIKLLRQGIIPS